MNFSNDIEKLINNPAWLTATKSLRRYLDERGYHSLYKYIVPPSSYVVTPTFFSQAQSAKRPKLLPNDGFIGCALGYCLTAHVPVPEAKLDEEERELALSLADIGLLDLNGATVSPRRFQLLSVGDRYLFVDAAIHFPEKDIHDIYIGPDSLLMMYCMGDVATGNESRALDLCSGSGVIGLVMTKTRTNVVSTDISPAALALIRINTELNGMEEKISIRKEALEETLDSTERFDLVACNPPFVALPPGFDRLLYATGPDKDGLGYMRALLEKVPNILNDGGEGYFVADMVGDNMGAYFFRELASFSEKGGCSIDAFVMNRIDAKLQVKVIKTLLQRLRPDSDKVETETLAARFILEELQASYYYLTVVKIKKGGKTGIRILNQFITRRFDDYFAK